MSERNDYDTRKLISIVVVLALLFPTTAQAFPKEYGDAEEIWAYLTELTPTKEIAAGILGYYFRESRLKADAVAGWDTREEGICESFTKETDAGIEKDEFVRRVQNFGGYGLGQWHHRQYLEALHEFLEETGYSLADVRGQCEFTVLTIQEDAVLWEELLECRTAIQCGRRIGLRYDGTSAEGAEAIAGFAQYYYERMVNDDGKCQEIKQLVLSAWVEKRQPWI